MKLTGIAILILSFISFLVWFDDLAKAKNEFRPKVYKDDTGKLYDKYKKNEEYPDASWIYHEIKDNLRRLRFTLLLAILGFTLLIL